MSGSTATTSKATGSTPSGDAGASGLRDLLKMLILAQTDLHAALESQLEAMRHADVLAMNEATARVGEVSRECERLDMQRRAIVGQLNRHGDGSTRDEAVLSELIRDFAPDTRQELSSLAATLRERMMTVADASRVATLACREMSEHFQVVLEAMADAAAPSVGYERSGRARRGELTVLDATG